MSLDFLLDLVYYEGDILKTMCAILCFIFVFDFVICIVGVLKNGQKALM